MGVLRPGVRRCENIREGEGGGRRKKNWNKRGDTGASLDRLSTSPPACG